MDELSFKMMGNSSQPLVSIIVPIYNVEEYLVECLDSIINQTLTDIEIILVNDGSTDSSLEIIQQYAERDERIIVIDKPNKGYGHSMNVGMKKASGKYIGIVESDDWIAPKMFETLYKMSERYNLDVARSEFFSLDATSLKNTKHYTYWVPHDRTICPLREQSVFKQQPSIWANLYLRSFLEDNKINLLETPGASYQDTSFSFKVYACANRFRMTSEAFYHYRVGGNSSSFQNKSKIYCVCDEYGEIWKFIKENHLYDPLFNTTTKIQFDSYKWNYLRLINPYRDQFFTEWHKEFKTINDCRTIIDREYSDEDKKLLKIVIAGDAPPIYPIVSVVVPVYNMEKYLRKCLDSIINQSLRELEIICVNDGSTDGSMDILNEYKSKDSRIIVIDKPNGGLSSARNIGIANAHTEFIGFVDSDDWVEKDTFKNALESMNFNDIVCFGTNVTGDSRLDHREDDNEYYRIKFNGDQILTDEMRLKTDVAVWNKLFRLKIIKENKIQFPEGLLYEDYSFYWRYILVSEKAFFIEDKYYNYLRRDDSIMAETFRQNTRSIEHLKIFPDIFQFGEEHHLWDDRKDTLNSMFLNCFWFAYWNSPVEMRENVLKLATKEVKSMGLSGDPTIEALRNRQYNLVDKNNNIGKTLIDKIKSLFNRNK